MTITKENKRSILPYGYKCFTGKVFSDCQVDSYNDIQKTINSFIDANLPVPEYLLVGSHNIFSCYANAQATD